jgi:hypothetical protein
MPSISAFYGIIIRMYFLDTDKHKMPHIHVFYGEDEAVFDLNGEILSGSFPKKQAAYVKAWCLLHEDELLANWKLAQNGEEVYKIDPLH